jgi:hypothetical protein
MSKYMKIGILSAMAVMAFRAEANDSDTGAAVGGTAPAATNGATNGADAAKAAEAAAEVKRGEIKAAFNNLVDVKDTSFFFRKVTNEVKNPETGEVSKVETKRPTVVLPVPVPSVEGIIAILEAGGKGLDLLLEAAASVVYEQAREYVNEHEEVTADNFPYDKMAWEVIANLPKAERRGGGISKELWEDFAKDYVEIMPGITGKKKESVEMAAKVFTTKFAGATTNKPVLKLLQAQLALYANNTTQGETLLPCIEFLQQKVEKLLNTDETNLLLAL